MYSQFMMHGQKNIKSCTMVTGSIPRARQPGRGVDHTPPSSAEVKGRVELYLFSPSGSSWPVIAWTLVLVRGRNCELLRCSYCYI